MHDQNKVEACRPNRLYRYKSRGFPAVRTSTPVSVILKADQSRRASRYVAHSQQRLFKLSTSLPIYGRRCPIIRPMNFVPIPPKIYHLRPECQYISAPTIARLLTGSMVKHCVVDLLPTFFWSKWARTIPGFIVPTALFLA